MSCQWNGREMLWGLETKEQGALLIMVTVSELSKEDSPLCPGIASVLFFFQIHEVRRVTALFSLSSEARYSVTHLSPQGGAESDRDPGSPTKWVFISQLLLPPPLGVPNMPRNDKTTEWHMWLKLCLKSTKYGGWNQYSGKKAALARSNLYSTTRWLYASHITIN